MSCGNSQGGPGSDGLRGRGTNRPGDVLSRLASGSDGREVQVVGLFKDDARNTGSKECHRLDVILEHIQRQNPATNLNSSG